MVELAEDGRTDDDVLERLLCVVFDCTNVETGAITVDGCFGFFSPTFY
jgi:hypothetical protein